MNMVTHIFPLRTDYVNLSIHTSVNVINYSLSAMVTVNVQVDAVTSEESAKKYINYSM